MSFPRVRRALRIAVAIAATAFAILCHTWITLPDVRSLARTPPESTAFMRLRESQAAAQGETARRRHRWVSYDQISPHLKRAVIVAEDGMFWEHEGLDFHEIRASMEKNWEEGEFTRGASTITQQLAKNLYLSPSKNPYRKVQELFIPPTGSGSLEAPDIRALPESDRVGRRHLGCGSSCAGVLRDLSGRSRCHTVRIARGRHHQPAGLQSSSPQRATLEPTSDHPAADEDILRPCAGHIRGTCGVDNADTDANVGYVDAGAYR
jgi:hypothetical protein